MDRQKRGEKYRQIERVRESERNKKIIHILYSFGKAAARGARSTSPTPSPPASSPSFSARFSSFWP